MRLGILGPLLVADDDGNQAAVTAARQRALLAALLVRANRTVPVEELAGLLWNTVPPGGAARTVRSYVVRLRRVVGPAVAARIVTSDPGYRCEVAEDELDVLRFEALCREGGAAARARDWQQARSLLAEALGLWRGAPLEDIASHALRQECGEQLEQARLRALQWRIEADLNLGRHEELTLELQALVREHPLREHGHAQLMLALYRCGRAAEALETFQRARRVLVQELGIEPGPELRALQEKILTGDPALAAPRHGEPAGAAGHSPVVVPRQLPPAAGYFTGRAEELSILSGLPAHAGGTVVISAIGGMAGVGKSTLAVHWAHQAAGRYPDGQLYVNLRGFDPSGEPVPAHTAVRNFLDGLGIPPERIPRNPQAQAALYRSLLAGKAMLIVLDNARDEQQVRPLLPASPGSLVLVTSRSQLAGLGAADGARLLSLDVLSHGEAVQLLTARLGAARASAEPGAAGEIADLCACLPLALSVAAARAAACPGFPLAALAAELRQAPSRLDALDAGEPPASVRAVFSWSYQQLSTAAARMFRLLGLHPGPDVSVPAAASLAGAAEPEAHRMLRELARGCLVIEHAPGRYAFHDLLRTYAAEKARDTDSKPGRAAAARRLLDHYLHTAHAAALLLNPAYEPIDLGPPAHSVVPERLTYRQAMAWFEAERPVLLAAISLAGSSGYDAHAWRIPWAMTVYLQRRGHWQEWAAVQGTALAAATRLGDTAGQAVTRLLLGNACRLLGDYGQARAHLENCLELYRQLGDRLGEAKVHHNLALLAENGGRYPDALGHDEQALRLYQATGHRPGEAAALNNIGWYNAHLGDYKQARALCQQSLSLAAELDGRLEIRANAWDSLGYTEHQLGNLAEAAACYQRALGLFRESGDRHHQADTLTHLGDTLRAAGNLLQAREAWQQALSIFDELGHPSADQVRVRLAGDEHRHRPPLR